MKKVLFFIHDLGQGGAEKVLVNLVNNLDRTKYEISVIALFGGGVNEKFLKDDVKYHFIFRKSFRGNSWLMKLFTANVLHSTMIKEEYDIEIAYLEGPSARIISGCNNPNTKTLSWIHCEQNDIKELKCGFRNFKEAIKCYNSFDHIICVSEAVRNAFINTTGFQRQIEVLYNTVESERIIEMSKEAVEDYSFGKRMTIVAVGSLKPIKGFDRLLRITKRLVDSGIDLNVIILGMGPLEEQLKQIVLNSALERNVYFLGYKTNPYKYIRNADVYVCSSLSEGFSTAATEALIVGTAVCTVDVPGMKELLGDNEFGIITENNEDALFDGLKNLLCDPKLLKMYSQKAAERGIQFSTRKTVGAVEAFLERD